MKQDNNNSNWSWFRSYFLCPEAIQLYLLLGLITWSYKKTYPRSGGNEHDFINTFRDHPQVWVPGVTALATNTINLFFSRVKENRELKRFYQHKNEEKSVLELETYIKEANKALENNQYPLALEQFTNSRVLYNEIHSSNKSNKSIQVLFSCVYGQAISAFFLRDYEKALILLAEILECNDYMNHKSGRELLLNLKGLINYNLGKLPLNKNNETNKYWKIALDAFSESLKIDKTQNHTYLFIRYLKGTSKDYKFISENLPSEIFNPLINLSTGTSEVLAPYIMEISAGACVKKQMIPHAICLREHLLDSSNQNLCWYIELANLSLQCVHDYINLLNATENKKFQLLTITVQSDLLELNTQEYDVGSVQKIMEKRVKQVITYLDGITSVTQCDSSSNAMIYINCGIMYQELAHSLQEIKVIDKEINEIDDLNSEAKKCFIAAQEFAKKNNDQNINSLVMGYITENEETVYNFSC
jgi:tetratricopeptide (TPR) repeat protein